MPASAETEQFGPRAGSNFSETLNRYGRISKRPYRRRQPTPKVAAKRASRPPAEKFDYRFDADKSRADAEPALFSEANYRQAESSVAEANHEDHNIEPVGYCDCGPDCHCGAGLEPGCGCDDYFEPGCSCDAEGCYEPSCSCDGYGCNSCGLGYGSGGLLNRGFGGMSCSAGFEWSFVKPRFSHNVAFTTMDGDAVNNSNFTENEFDYDLELTPRVWIEAMSGDNWGWRVSYWQFDGAPGVASAQPDADGFGEITHPTFGDVDISSIIPTDTFTASSSLDAYTIDVEALKHARVCGWHLGVGGGVRYASADQTYSARLRDVNNALLGQIDFAHAIEGVGPTMSLSARRPLARSVKLVCAARGSLLFGDGSSRLFADENANVADDFITTRTTNREDLLSIGEARVGLEWMSPRKRSSSWQWLISGAMEGQYWGNAGNASNETADLGFFGFNVGAGFRR